MNSSTVPVPVTSKNAACVLVHDREHDVIALLHHGGQAWSVDPAWTLPGGKVEPGERLDQAGARELQEETGLTVRPGDLELIQVIDMRADPQTHFVLFVFATSIWTGDLVNVEPEKHLEVRWVDRDDLPEPMFPTATTALAAYRNEAPRYLHHGR